MSSLRRFLYISPYFPPQSRVGALRPLKFARHLPDHGWAPVVLADLWPAASIDLELVEKIPSSAVVIRDYSRRGLASEASMSSRVPKRTEARKSSGPRLSRLIPDAINNPELVPLGEHSVHIPHAIKAARRALERHPECEAIMVNADPYAALMVGASVARSTGLPLVQDLRDPWSVCELRRPRRPAPIRHLVDALEHRAFAAASRVILNTQTTLQDTVAHYRGKLPESLFTCIRNHGDRALISGGSHPGFSTFTALFLGNFRRFLEGDILLEAMARLKARDVGEGQVQLVVTGSTSERVHKKAADLGVAQLFVDHPFVPYTQIGSVMEAADLLLVLSNSSTQRIPAKFYDYATTRRPMLAIANSEEFGGLVGKAGGKTFALDDPEAIASEISRVMEQGRHQEIHREAMGLSSEEASAQLAQILDEVTQV